MAVSQNKVLLKNTVFLYVRTILLFFLGLYTSRVTMQALGVENYGIINVVGGFVSMFALISGSLTSTCQRFLTFELGKIRGDVKQVFSASFYIHLILAVIVAILAETIGLYFVNTQLNLPIDKMDEVQWVFHCSVISFVLNLLNIPFNGLIVAHEKMKAFAYISIVEAVLKLLTVYALLVFPFNALVLYSCLMLVSATIVRIVYQIYCLRSFGKEVKLVRITDTELFKNIFGFAGWAFIGNTATLLNNQGINLILNIFVGVTVNAARGVASMVENIVTSFVNNFTTALNPQLIKAYSKHETVKLLELLDLGLRLSFFLTVIMAIPIISVTEDILKIWLDVYPDYSIVFIRITMLSAIIQAMANPYVTTIAATGNIRTYQIVIGSITLLNIPLCYIFLKIGLSPVWVYISSLCVYIITFIIRLLFVRNKAGLAIQSMVSTIIFRILPIGIIGFVLSYMLSKVMHTERLFGLGLYGILSCLMTGILIYLFGLKNNERMVIHSFVKSKILKK